MIHIIRLLCFTLPFRIMNFFATFTHFDIFTYFIMLFDTLFTWFFVWNQMTLFALVFLIYLVIFMILITKRTKLILKTFRTFFIFTCPYFMFKTIYNIRILHYILYCSLISSYHVVMILVFQKNNSILCW